MTTKMELVSEKNLSEVLNNYTNYTTVHLKANNSSTNDPEVVDLYPFSLVVPFTIIYIIIFIIGVIGNISTCIVIAKNKFMQTATNCYLFSLACSDLLLLLSGLPPEMYRIWSPDKYIFGQAFCILQGFAAETSANATVLTITAFTVERYIAICHPFLSHTMSKVSRAVKFILAIWVLSLALAVPQAIQFGVHEAMVDGVEASYCTVINKFFDHAFEISTFVFFVGPMTLITILYVLIGIRLRKSNNIAPRRRTTAGSNGPPEEFGRAMRATPGQRRVVKMLIAVVAAFFICWAPFHAQRLLAVYLSTASPEAQESFFHFYLFLMYTSGVLYFVSTTVNPVLYHIMSKKFRKAFKDTFASMCSSQINEQSRGYYSTIRKVPPAMRDMQRSVSEGVTQVTRDFQERRGNSERAIHFKGRSDSKVSNSSRSSYFSSSSRCSSLYERNKSYGFDKDNTENADSKKYFILPLKFSKIFGRNKAAVAGSSNNNANAISNSSLKDTEVTEFNHQDLVNTMNKINDNIK